jgi:hypothetical protein
MNVCAPFLPQGINKSCLADLKEIKNIIVTDASVTFATTLLAQTLSTWKAKVQTDLSVYAPLGVNDYDPTTDDPNIVTHGSTRKTVTNNPIPSGVFYLASNFCDYKDVQDAFRGGFFRMFLVDSNGSLYGTRTDVGVVKGFLVELTAPTKGLPLKEVGNNFKVYANFQNYDEFKNAVIVPLTWNPTLELSEAMPAGLNLYVTSAITAGSVVVTVLNRCGTAKTGLVAADWEVLESSQLVTPGIATSTEGANGSYTLTLKKSTNTPLAAGDMVVIRVKLVASTVVTYISNRITINALA